MIKTITHLNTITRQEPPCSVVGVLTTWFQMKIIETPVLQLLTEVLNTNLRQRNTLLIDASSDSRL